MGGYWMNEMEWSPAPTRLNWLTGLLRVNECSLDRGGRPTINRAIGPVIGLASQAAIILLLSWLQGRSEIIRLSKLWMAVLVLVGLLAAGGAGLGGVVAVEVSHASNSASRAKTDVEMSCSLV